MGLIHNECVIFIQVGIGLGLHEENAICHKLYIIVAARPVVEANLVSHRLPHTFAQLFGHPLCHCDGGNPPGLGAADHATNSPTRFDAHLRNLGGLAGTGLADNNDHTVILYGLYDFILF